MAKTKISQFDATAANNTDLNSISIAEGTAPSNINNAIRELMSQLADLNLGNEVLSTLKIDNLHLDGNTIVTLDTNGDLNLTPNGTGSVVVAKVDINGGAIDGTPIGGSSASTGAFTTLSASSTANLGSSVTVSGGNIDGVIGANTPAAITGTVITANTNFAGNLTGNVTGTVDGVVGGTTPAAVTGTTITANTKFVGAIDGNVTATSGTSTFNNVTINGTLDMDSTTSQTITGLATPSGSTDAATKGYVDTEVSGLVDSAPAALNTLNELAAALGDDASFSTTVTNSIAAKLPLAGGTMTGDINANSNTVSGLKAPSASNDATTKTYVDTADALKLNLSGGTLSGNLAMGDNKVTGLAAPTADGDAARKKYVDDIAGSGTAAATSASAAATSATASATSATASASSATAAASSATSAAASYDSFDDRYLGAKSSAPSVDNDGDALVTGALYWNTSSNDLYVWNGSAWEQGAFSAGGVLSNVVEDTTPQLGGDLDAQGKDIQDVGIVSADGIAGIYGSTSSPITYTVTVASKTAAHPYNGDGSSSAYFLNGIESPALQLQGVDGTTANTEYFYKFDQSDSSNSGHPLRFYKDAAKAEAYTSGVTTSGTAGSSGAYTTIAVDDATPNVLYYECSSHAYMGNYVTTPATSVQGLDAELTAIAGLTSAADKGIQFTGTGSAGTFDLTAAGKALLDDSDAAAQRTTLGLGTAATLTAGTSASNAVQLDGSAKLPAVDGSALTGLASGGTVNMVADGDIAIRKPVVLTAAGKAKEVAQTTTFDTNPTASTITEQNGTAYSYYGNSIAYESTSGYYVRGRRVASSNYPCVESGTWGSLTAGITWNTPTVLSSESLRGNKVMVGTGGGYAHLAYCTREDSNENAKVTPVAISGTGSLSLGTTTTVNTLASSGSNTEPYGVEYDTSQNTILAFFYLGWQSGYVNKVFPLQMSGANYSYSSSDAVTLTSGIDIHKNSLNTVFDPDTNRTIFFYNKNDVTEAVHGIVLSCSGTTITKGSTQSPSLSTPTSNCWTNVAYDTQNNKIIFMYYVNSPVNYAPKYSIVTVTGGGTNTLSFTSDAYVFANTSQQAQACTLAWNGDVNRLFMVYPAYTGSHIQCNTFTSNGSTLTTISQGEISTNEMTDSEPNENTASVFVTGKGVSYSLGNAASQPGIVNLTLSISSTTSSTLDNGNYLGISAAAISDTATGKINVIGGTSTGHSSLTIGNHYFTNGNGVIGLVGNTTGEQYVGRAISATEIQLLENEGYLYGTAEGAVTAGKPVIVATDGEFEQVKETSTSITYAAGSATEIEEGWLDQRVISYDVDENKFLVAYRDQDQSSHGFCKVLSVSGTTVSYGSESSAFNSNSTNVIDSVYDAESGNHVIFYTNSSSYGYAVVASISGTSVTFGTPVAFNSATTHYRGTCYYDSTNKKVVWIGGLPEQFANYRMKGVVGTVSGTSISFGSLQDSGVASTDYYSSAYDSSNSVGVYARQNSTYDGYIGTVSVSGTTMTWNTPVNFNGTDNVIQEFDSMTYDSVNQKIVHTFKDSADDSLQAIVGTVSGTSISFGTKVEAVSNGNGGNTAYFSIVGTLQGVVPLVYRDGSNGYLKYLQGTVSGTSISFAGGATLDSTNIENVPAIAYDSNNYGIVTSYSDSSTHDLWAVAVTPSGTITTTNMPTDGESYLGIATKTVADDAQVEVATFGQIDAQQSGLTVGQKYFVQDNGSLGTSASSTATMVAGKALSATKLLINE